MVVEIRDRKTGKITGSFEALWVGVGYERNGIDDLPRLKITLFDERGKAIYEGDKIKQYIVSAVDCTVHFRN